MELFLLSIFCIIVVSVSQGSINGHVGRRRKFGDRSPRIVKRMQIIRCCGKKSCFLQPKISTQLKTSSLKTSDFAEQKGPNKSINSDLGSTLSQLDNNFELSKTQTWSDAVSLRLNEQNSPGSILDTAVSTSPSFLDLTSSDEKLMTTPIITTTYSAAEKSVLNNEVEISTTPTHFPETNRASSFSSNQFTGASTSKFSVSTFSATTTSTKEATTTTIAPELIGKCVVEANAVNRSLFLTNGALAGPDLHGFWLDACGQTLLLGKSLGTWQENKAKCFSLNMQPFALESREKLECMKLQAKSWKFNLNYWTGGTKDLASGTFGWCSTNGTSPLLDILPLVNLASDQNCVRMKISKTNGSISISDQRCSNRIIFACQGPPTTAPKCTGPICPNITCQRDPLLFTSDNKSSVLKNHTLHGRWFTDKLRQYLLSFENDTRTYLEAMKVCCALGMSLLSLDGNHKYEALANICNSPEMIYAPENMTFWTSGSDEGCESTFGFCTAKRLFGDEAKWLPGQPDNAGQKENYVAVNILRSQRQVLLADYDGRTKFRYICEKRRNPQSKSGKQAIIDECSVIYNVSQIEIDLLQNASNFDTRMKCFLKCVGEAAGLVLGGKFVESEIFAILELMALLNEDDISKNMAIMQECNKKSSGLDECDKVYQLAKCARDKSPAVFDQVVKDLNIQDSENDELISKGYGCHNIVPCPINVTEKNVFDSINISPMSCNYDNANYWVCKCSDLRKILIFYKAGLIYTHQDAVRYCCERGLRLLQPQNYVKTSTCINSAAIASGEYANWTYTMLNAVVLDAISGYSFDCETQTEFLPKMLHPNYNFRTSPPPDVQYVNSAGPLYAMSRTNQARSPEYYWIGSNINEVFMCEEKI
ncbi:uncharacterized protein LOC132195825 isoform X2 [Neocloeon triangulifer]|uniref:uncharacterized protein LOC132195825 isoform X2 n=1 Tax=Neocloeon triangulifer TaxID=2078957 RepID=UPI00286EC884|nr:uncharacterized protein LOC132195825 isoform X2 [Neocloeon triangulifer]